MTMADIERIERELREGLEGVTRGPWLRESAEDDGTIFIVADDLGGLVGAALPWPTEAISGGSERVEANAAHMARCDPDTIRALLDELARRAEIIERAKEVIRPFAGASVDASGWAVIVHDQTAKDARNTARAFLASLEPTHAE